jgi:hypothetical protein
MLEPQDEYMLAKRWREHGDRDAAQTNICLASQPSQASSGHRVSY